MIAHAPLVLDIAGTTLTADDRRRIKHPLVGGLVLFARNWVDRRQLTGLCAEVKALRDSLRARGHEVWFDEEQLGTGLDWEQRI